MPGDTKRPLGRRVGARLGASHPQGGVIPEVLLDAAAARGRRPPCADRVWRTRSQLELAVVEYIGWFNHDRLHQALGDTPPTWRPSALPGRDRKLDPARQGRRVPRVMAVLEFLKS
jgi:transposase InsO family protein